MTVRMLRRYPEAQLVDDPHCSVTSSVVLRAGFDRTVHYQDALCDAAVVNIIDAERCS